MNEQLKQTLDNCEVKWYSEKIVDMVNRIKNEKFLRRIYIILNDYLYKYNF